MDVYKVKALDFVEYKSEYEQLVKGYVCTRNYSVEKFLRESSLVFTEKKQSMTTLVYDNKSNLQGYYTLAIKALELDVSSLTNAVKRKVQRVATKKSDSVYVLPCILLAQLGKNYASYIDKSERIAGKELFELALEDIIAAQTLIGGVACYVECENVQLLKDFYTGAGFKPIGSRTANKSSVTLLQYIKIL